METMMTWQETMEIIPHLPVPRIVDSEALVTGRFLQTSKKNILYPDGVSRPWEAVSRPEEVVSVLAQTSERVLILIAECRPLLAPRWNISLPAGLVDAGDTKEDTCRKELRQETGYV